jgi:hypothetical protein
MSGQSNIKHHESSLRFQNPLVVRQQVSACLCHIQPQGHNLPVLPVPGKRPSCAEKFLCIRMDNGEYYFFISSNTIPESFNKTTDHLIIIKEPMIAPNASSHIMFQIQAAVNPTIAVTLVRASAIT